MTAKKKTELEPVADMTIDEVTESITGYDELGIEEQYKLTLPELTLTKNTYKWTRAHVAIYLLHKGKRPAEAWKTALSLTVPEVQAYFPKSVADPDDITDESDEGKGDAAPVATPTTKRRSASQPA